MTKSPYLIYPGDPTQMKVLWQLSGTDTCRIAWGADTACTQGSVPTSEYGTDHQHAFTITGLTPGTKTYYRVTNEGNVRRGSFTAAPPASATHLRFFAYGDTRTYPASHDQVAAAMISAINAEPAYQTFTLFMGDFVFYGNNETYWTNEFFSSAYPDIRGLMALLPYQACMGNHENSSPVLFTKYFPYPWVNNRYWSFDYGPVHVAVVDQYSTYASGPQYDWLVNDLRSSTKTWKFVLLHEPGWSAGGGHANNNTVQAFIEPLCEQYGVAILFAGHNHYYARAVVNGVQHVTTGGGGAPLDTPVLPATNVVTATRSLDYCQIAIDDGVLRFEALSPAGALLDSFTLVRTVADVVPPTVLVTSPAGGESWTAGSTHDVTWSASDNVGVDSVNVDYSLGGAGGPWLPVAHGQANSGSLPWTLPAVATDSALVRVSAFDVAGNSGSATGANLFHIVDASAAVTGEGRAVLALARPLPNPSTGAVSLRFSLPAAGHARLEVLDPAGRRVWHAEADVSAGPHAWSWTGLSDRGTAAGTGLFFVRLMTPWGTRVERLARLR
jgi:hypothetical protein